MSKSYSYYFPPSPGPVFKISMVLQLLWQQKVETGVITTRALGSLLCTMPLEKVTRRSYNIWSSALRSLSPGRKKKNRCRERKLARGYQRRLEQKPDPSPIRNSRPAKSHNPDRQSTKEKPTTERKCFPTKAISSNLYSSNKFASSFWCHYSKVTRCLLTRKKLLSFFNDCKYLPMHTDSFPPVPWIWGVKPRACQGLSGFGNCEVFHTGPWIFSSGFGEAIKVYNWTVNMDKYSVAHFYKSLTFIELFCTLAVSD